jgi:hypothetical protein
MNKEIISQYLLSRLCWPNKDTIPDIKINELRIESDNIHINHDVLFKSIGSNEYKKYFSSIECIVWKRDITNFIREKNINDLI